MSIIDPLTCGFVKVFRCNLFTQTKNNNLTLQEILNTIKASF